MKTLKHILGTFILALLIIAIIQPAALIGAFDTSVRVVAQSATATTSVRQLTPASVSDYLEPMQPLIRQFQNANDRMSIEEIIDATNRERIHAGLTPLRSNTILTKSAAIKVEDMIVHHYFEHASPDGKQVWDLAKAAGYNYVVVGENLARGDFVDAHDVVSEWMDSPGHRANMLSPKYQEIGAYAARGMYNGQEVWFVVQHFGTERDACPEINTKLLSTITAMDKNLTERRARIAAEKAEILTMSNYSQDDEYKQRVIAFNRLVADYNTQIVLSEEKIKVYNAQVAAFNACLNNYK